MRAAFRLYYFCAYLAFRACEALVRLLPLDAAFVLGEAGGRVACRLLARRRALAFANLRLAFGSEKSEDELHALNREHFRLLGANLLAGLKSSTMCNEKIWERVDADVPQDRARTGWIALISHIGNWELFSHLGEKFPEYRFGAIYQSLANPYIDRYLRRTRARSGITLFDRRTEMLKCVRFLRDGGVVGVLVDQGAGYAGLWTPLFNRLTSSTTLPATLSIRTGLPVVPLAIYTRGRARWQMKIGTPVYPTGEEDAEALTANINRLLEEQIRVSPADWLWAHNRWKPLRPHLLFARDQRRVFFPPEFDRARLDAFRILVVSPPTAEQAAAAQRAIKAIARGRPDIWLAVLAPRSAVTVWRGSDDVQQVIEFDSADTVRTISSRIRQAARFDAAIFFDGSAQLLAAIWRAGIPIRVCRHMGVASRLCNQRVAIGDQGGDEVRANLEIAHSIGANINEFIEAGGRSPAEFR